MGWDGLAVNAPLGRLLTNSTYLAWWLKSSSRREKSLKQSSGSSVVVGHVHIAKQASICPSIHPTMLCCAGEAFLALLFQFRTLSAVLFIGIDRIGAFVFFLPCLPCWKLSTNNNSRTRRTGSCCFFYQIFTGEITRLVPSNDVRAGLCFAGEEGSIKSGRK